MHVERGCHGKGGWHLGRTGLDQGHSCMFPSTSWLCDSVTYTPEMKNWWVFLQGCRQRRRSRPLIPTSGWWQAAETLSVGTGGQRKLFGERFGHRYPCPAFPAVKEPSKTSLWARGKQILMSRVMHNDHQQDIPMSLFIDTKNMPTHWNLGCIHGISYHSLLSADWWLVRLTRDEGRTGRGRGFS